MKYLLTLVVAAILSTAAGFGVGFASTLHTSYVQPGRMQLTHQVQGGYRQTVQQPEATIDYIQPEGAQIQGDQEDSDNLQPAMGYNATTWNLQ